MQKERLAIIVPYRNRKSQLDEFIPYMENYLKGFDFKILIIEQANNLPFNRAMLMNIGFAEAKDYDSFVFHDVDCIPIDGDYSYSKDFTHLSGKIEEYGWSVPHENCMGGVLMTDKASFIKVNGWANEYWGWGDEDNEMYDRSVIMKVPFTRRPGRYRTLKHDRYSHTGLEKENSEYREKLKERLKDDTFTDGYSTLEYTKLGETKLSEHGVMVHATFKPKREIKTSQWSILKKNIRFRLGIIKRKLLGKEIVNSRYTPPNE